MSGTEDAARARAWLSAPARGGSKRAQSKFSSSFEVRGRRKRSRRATVSGRKGAVEAAFARAESARSSISKALTAANSAIRSENVPMPENRSAMRFNPATCAQTLNARTSSHCHEKSDSAIVAGKSSNKAGEPAAETMERRAEAKENADQQTTRRAQNRESVSRALDRVRVARHRKKERLTTLFHHITVDLLRLSFLALKRDAAPGMDGVAWQDYERDLEQKLSELHEKIHRGAYRAKP